jgi:hypothetical protein
MYLYTHGYRKYQIENGVIPNERGRLFEAD